VSKAVINTDLIPTIHGVMTRRAPPSSIVDPAKELKQQVISPLRPLTD